jgi:Protein of unknown function (DUF995)
MKFVSVVLYSVFLSMIGLAAVADPLPSSAKPLSSKWITKAYSGNSALWDTSMVYFAPDGTTIGVYGNPPQATFAGSWVVKKNKICMTNVPTNIKTKKLDTRTYTDCWIYYADGKTILTSYYNDFQEGKGPNDEYSEGELSNLKKGDKVSAKFAKYVK